MSWLFLEPSDVWLFRDSRPFSAGEGYTARTLYPPSPFTVQGALRSHLLGSTAVDWQDFAEQSTEEARTMAKQIGHPPRGKTPGELGNFAMRGPFRARLSENGKAEIVYPPPLDIYYPGEKHWLSLRPAKLDKKSFHANWPDTNLYPLLPDAKYPRELVSEERADGLTLEAMVQYLEGKSFGRLSESELQKEWRVGIAMDYASGRAADRMLYQVEFARPTPGYGLLVELTDKLNWPEEAVISMGGEARATLVRRLPANAPELPPTPSGRRLKIVLQTPAWFSDGWRPKNSDWAGLFEMPSSAGLTCVAAAVGRPLYIGGWEVAHGRQGHKPLRGFVPPGSVYYFEAKDDIQLPGAFTGQPAGELSFASQGFGAFVAGTWDWLEQTGTTG